MLKTILIIGPLPNKNIKSIGGTTIYRPSQINIHGTYGWELQISRIKKLTLNEYEEEPVVSTEPNFRKGLCGIHHLHQIDGYFVFDACFKRHR